MTARTTSPQPHAVERKNKHPSEGKSNLSGNKRNRNKTLKKKLKI